MKITFVEPRTELKSVIQSIWIFESPVGMPVSASGMAAPSGRSKMIINYENSIISIVEGRASESKEGGFYFVGQRDIPVHIATPGSKTGFIGVEFSPYGAYSIFGIPMIETTNSLVTVEELLGKRGRELSVMLYDIKTPLEKIAFLQDWFAEMIISKKPANSLVEHCVNCLKASNGLLPISQLERNTGYSRRYFEMIFKNHVGLSPKALAGIFRFQKFYKMWAEGLSYEMLREGLYDYYYDQSHFVKEFKRMTGFSPQHFTNNITNEFGRRLSLR